jgi:hypothetical protein
VCWQLGKRQHEAQNELADDQVLLPQVQVQVLVQVRVQVQVLRHQDVAQESIELGIEKYWILSQ